MPKTSPFQTETYCSRTKRIKRLEKPGCFWEGKILSTFAVFLFVFIDFKCLKAAWNLVQTEDSSYIACAAIACAIALDIPLAIGAAALKKYHQGLVSKAEKNMVFIPAIIVFALAFACNFGFRLTTRENTFEITPSSNLTNTVSLPETDNGNPKTPEKGETSAAAPEEGTAEADSQAAILFAGIYSGIIPLLTSLSSFVISYFSSDPKKYRLAQLEKEKISLQTHIGEAQRQLSEIQSPEEFCAELIARERDLYKEFQNQLDADSYSLKQLVRILLMEKLQTAESITSMTAAAQNLVSDSRTGDKPAEELLAFVAAQTGSPEENGKIVPIFTGNASYGAAESSSARISAHPDFSGSVSYEAIDTPFPPSAKKHLSNVQ